MRNFWGSFFGSILGSVISSILFAVLVIAGVAAVVSAEFGGSEQVMTDAEEKTVLHLKFSYPIIDSKDQNPFAEIDFGSGSNTKLTAWETIQVPSQSDFAFTLSILRTTQLDSSLSGFSIASLPSLKAVCPVLRLMMVNPCS